jgi:hypothetical protein
VSKADRQTGQASWMILNGALIVPSLAVADNPNQAVGGDKASL